MAKSPKPAKTAEKTPTKKAVAPKKKAVAPAKALAKKAK